MSSNRAKMLIRKLSRGLHKSQEIFGSLSPDQWTSPIFDAHDPWCMKDLLAHYVSTEERFLRVAQDIAAGGMGSPEDFDIDLFNKNELERLKDRSVEDLISSLDDVRASVIAWVQELDGDSLDRTGKHPVLGIVNVETVIHSIYAHQLLHMRDVLPRLEAREPGQAKQANQDR